jgi:hypothetical protein
MYRIEVQDERLFKFQKIKPTQYNLLDSRPKIQFKTQIWFFNDEVHEWFNENKIGYFLHFREAETPFDYHKITAMFQSSEDAVLFKLRWIDSSP